MDNGNTVITATQEFEGVVYELKCTIPLGVDIFVYMNVWETILKTLTFSNEAILKGFENKKMHYNEIN